MTIRYQNTFRDIVAFCFYHYLRSPMVLGVYGVGFALISLAVFHALPKDEDVVTKVMAFAIIELIVFSFLATVSALSVVLSMVSRRNKTFLTEHSLDLGE